MEIFEIQCPECKLGIIRKEFTCESCGYVLTNEDIAACIEKTNHDVTFGGQMGGGMSFALISETLKKDASNVIEKLIKTAEHCLSDKTSVEYRCRTCPGADDIGNCVDFANPAVMVLTLRDSYAAQRKTDKVAWNAEISRYIRIFMKEAATGGTHMDIDHSELLAEAIETLDYVEDNK